MNASPDSREECPETLIRAAELLIRYPFRPWYFGDSIAFDALELLSSATGNLRWESFAYGYFRGWGATVTQLGHEDKVAPGRAIVSLASKFQDASLLALVYDLTRVLLDRRRIRGVLLTREVAPLRLPANGAPLSLDQAALLRDPGAGVHVDVMHFEPALFVNLGLAIGDHELLTLGVDEILAYCELLQDNATGIFFHFFLERTGKRYGYGWSRGQGWAMLGLLDVLRAIGPTHKNWTSILERLLRLLRAMHESQRSDGHWPVLIADPQSAVDTSAAAFYVATVEQAAADRRIELPELFESSVERAWEAISRDCSKDGLFRGVTAAVGSCTEDSHHNGVPTGGVTPWGQGALVAAAAARLARGKQLSLAPWNVKHDN